MHKKESKANSHQHTNKQAWGHAQKPYAKKKKQKKENKIKQYGVQKPA